jgi:hypothetical protein
MSYADAIASIESGGNYGILGPATKSGDRAYGKYQIMGANIPQWTKEVLGAPMKPQEFLANPDAQDQVFSAKFGQYVDKYGPEGAAAAWFAGPGNMNNPNASDGNTTVGQYVQKFRQAMAPPLPMTNIGGSQQPPIAGPQIPGAPQQQQQLPAPGGGPSNSGAFQPQQLPMLQAPSFQPKNLTPYLQQVMQNFPALRGYLG